jgi:hypothetical protein
MNSHQAMSILVVIKVALFIYLYSFVEVECGLPLYFKCKFFQEVADYPPFGQSFDLHISFTMSILREEIVPSIEDVFVAL